MALGSDAVVGETLLRPLTLLLILFALVSGCVAPAMPPDEAQPDGREADDDSGVDPAEDAGTSEGAAAAATSGLTLLRFNGSFVAGGSAPLPGDEPRRVELASDNGVFDFAVNPDTVAVVVELVKGGDTTGELLLGVGDAKGAWTQTSTGSPGQAGTQARLEFKDLAPGTWKAGGYADGAAAQASYELYVSLFAGPVPEGYTAIPVT